MKRQEKIDLEVIGYEFGEYVCGRGLANDWDKGLTFTEFSKKFKDTIINKK